MRCFTFVLLMSLSLIASPAQPQAPAASPFQEPVNAYFDDNGLQFGHFAQNGNAIFMLPNGTAYAIPMETTGFLRGIPMSHGGYIHYDGPNCTGTPVAANSQTGGSIWDNASSVADGAFGFFEGSLAPLTFIVFDPHSLRAWAIGVDLTEDADEFVSVSYLNYNQLITDPKFGECRATKKDLPPDRFTALNFMTEVTDMFVGFVPPFALQPLP